MSLPDNQPLLDLVERCILAFESDGETGLEQALIGAEELAAETREHIAALRTAGLLLPPDLPERIGAWRVLKRLGNGGMGTVYLGEQSAPIARRAAIKVIRRGMDSHEVLARFAIEQKALAMLDHPGIARMLDAGSTADGRPYLVMDYVAGPPLLRYCDERQLDTRQRLSLFASVCAAVQYAHQKGLLHRDLKPSNILVTDRGAEPCPVVIDFGVAKSVGGSAAAAQLTLPGHLLGTPEYMSPEQAANESDVDTRTDVYSLGVILYELLTSKLPFDSGTLRTKDLVHALRHMDAPTPSTRITSLGEAASTVAAQRRTSIGTLRRALRGDLDWIVMKALDRDRNRRYGMPGELAADIDRHLRNEPITAGAPGLAHRLVKFCARNRLQVIAAGLVLGSLVAGLVTSTLFYREAAASSRAAVASSRAAVASLDAALLAVGELVQVGDSDLLAVPHLEGVRRDLLLRSVDFYRDFLARDTGADARLLPRTLDALLRLSGMHQQLGQLDDAMQRLLEVDGLLATPAAAELPSEVRLQARLDSLQQRAHGLDRIANKDGALALLRQAEPTARELLRLSPGHDSTQSKLQRLLAFQANLLQHSDPESAMRLFDEALGLAQQLHARHPDDVTAIAQDIRARVDRADFLFTIGRRDEGRQALADVRGLASRVQGRPSWSVVQSMLEVTNQLHRCELPREVLEVAGEIAPVIERWIADHPSVVPYRNARIRLLNARANAHLLQRDFDAAIVTQRLARLECEATLVLAPLDVQLQRQLIVCCTNLAMYHKERRILGGRWDADDVESALSRATQVLELIPAGEAQAVVRQQRLEVHGLWGVWREAKGDRSGACSELMAALGLAETLVAEAPTTVDYQTRLAEMRRRLLPLLLDEGRHLEALTIADRAVRDSEQLGAATEGRSQWNDRHRDLLLLQLRARAASGDADGAMRALDEHLTSGGDRDWIGHQSAASALTRAVESLPLTDPSREHFVARARELVESGMAFAPAMLEHGAGPGMVLVMRGNTLVLATRLEAAAGDFAAAAERASEAVEAYAEVWQGTDNERNKDRVQRAAETWLRQLVAAGDERGLRAAFERTEQLFAQHAASLADLAGQVAQSAPATASPPLGAAVRGGAIKLLQRALREGLPVATLQEARFVALQAEPAFMQLAAQRPAPADKQ